MFKKVLIGLVAMSTIALGNNIGFNIYTGYQYGNWRLRNSDDKESLSKGAFNFKVEGEVEVYNHMIFILGTGYETGFELKNGGSYDIIPLYIGGRFEYHADQEVEWNPYIIGRLGYPIVINKKNIELDSKRYNGWAHMGVGVVYRDRFLAEIGYKQHVTNYTKVNRDYDARLFSIDFGYKFN